MIVIPWKDYSTICMDGMVVNVEILTRLHVLEEMNLFQALKKEKYTMDIVLKNCKFFN